MLVLGIWFLLTKNSSNCKRVCSIKRIIQEQRTEIIDATYGRRTRAVIITNSDHVVLSALQPETVASRIEDIEPDTSADNIKKKKKAEREDSI